ncbi:MAG TPA: zinc metalloprotease [Actinomycetota bacterium]|nr:zinc metalloprotease [Actinomycetota bacterium]
MSIKRFLLAAAAASILVVGFVPVAQAARLDARVCVERHADVAPEGRARDFVQAPKVDRLQRWIKAHPRLAAEAAARPIAGGAVAVDVWVHVIRKDTTIAGGNLPASRIAEQIQVLNDSYSSATGGDDAGFSFTLAGVTRTTNQKWFNLTSNAKDREIKAALKVGGPETLNIYTAKLGQNLLGYAYLAQDAEDVGVLDGVVVHFQTLPGGNFTIYSEGDTATHEVGHWLDLFHTFEGGCEGPGDSVADTAPEASPAFNCPTGRDTCAGGGLDPITNFMDYTQDSCMFEFTAGQASRMQQAWTAFRAP